MKNLQKIFTSDFYNLFSRIYFILVEFTFTRTKNVQVLIFKPERDSGS